MTHHNRATRLEHYLTTLMPETHGHQRKAFRDFVTALLTVRTCCQATLARYFPTFEAASRRLTRWLHNPRLDPQGQARAQAQAVVAQLPLTGLIRVAIDWTTEAQPPLLVASVVVGRRAVPLYWEAYTTAERKGQQRALEVAFVDCLFGQLLTGSLRERVLVTADRGFCAGTFLDELAHWGVGFVLRLTASVKVLVAHQWCTVGSLPLRGTTRRRLLGHLWCLRTKPRRYWVAQSRARTRQGRWEHWPLVSTRPLSAFPMAQA